MFIDLEILKERIHGVILNKASQGHDVEGAAERLHQLSNSYDDLIQFAATLADLPMRKDWQYTEPNEIDAIWAESDPTRPLGKMAEVDLDDSSKRVEQAFLGSVAGCMLGKPIEVRMTGDEIKIALKKINDWPLTEYISENIKSVIPTVHRSFDETVREKIKFVAPDDDINYTIMGMLILEEFGPGFTHKDVRELWVKHLPLDTTFGPERTMLIKSGLESLGRMNLASFEETGGVASSEGGYRPAFFRGENPVNIFLNPGDELCGAVIRADAYGYACPGYPEKAAELAWKDASFTHNRTGIYGTMFVAAAIAMAQISKDRMSIFDTALKFVPMKSRFYERVKKCFELVSDSKSWEEGYAKINDLYGDYGHCRVYQDIGMLINTMKFANDVGDGICIQVSQGADTDSFGASAGSILGAYFGPGSLDQKWTLPFNDDIHTGMAWFFERSLSDLASRMGELPKRIYPTL